MGGLSGAQHDSLSMPSADDDHIEGVADALHVVLFQLEPVGGALGGLIGAVQCLHDQALRAGSHGVIQEHL